MGGRRSLSWPTLLLIAALVGTSGVLLPGADGAVHAQAPDPFAIPAAEELASAAANAVVDVPVPLAETIDLGPALETAVSHIDALPSEEWEVLGVAPTLGESPTAAFELLRDRVGFDAYPGALRGSEGTLTARAGNAFDRALLLKALLDEQGFTSRFAFGQLGPEVAAELVERSLQPPVSPLPVPGFSPFGADFEAAVRDRARRDYALLSDALGERLSGLDADGTPAARADLASHAWVQVEQADGTWLDLDPTLPDSQPGQALTSVESTSDVMPDEAWQSVTLRLISETLQDGQLGETIALELSVIPAIAADQQVLLAFAPSGGASGGGLMGGGGGGVLAGGGESVSEFAPVLMIDGSAWQGDPIAISSSGGGGGGLFGGGGSSVDLSGLFLEVETAAPSAAAEVARHPFLDRVPPAIRASGSVTSGDLVPVGDVEGIPAVFTTIVHVMLSTGGSSPLAYAFQQGSAIEQVLQDEGTGDAGGSNLPIQYHPLAVGELTLAIASEQRAIPGVDDAEVRALITRPRVYLASWAIDVADPALIVAETDLLLDGIRTLPRSGAAGEATARHQLWYGALQGAIETEHALRAASTLDPTDLVLTGASFEMDEPLTVLSSADGGTLDPATHPSLRAMVGEGDIILVPGAPSQATVWWQVTHDGATKAILAPRLGAGRVTSRPPPQSAPRRVERIERLPDQTKQQRRPDPKPTDEWQQGNAAQEYGTVVEKVGDQTTQGANAAGEELKKEILRARLALLKP